MFSEHSPGALVPIAGTDPVRGPWQHQAFVPWPLKREQPALSPASYRAVAEARAAIAGLDSTARWLPNPTLLRAPVLRSEAQSTSALEGTYAPLNAVLVADEDDPPTAELVEILNYVRMANHAFAWVQEGRPLSVGMLCDLHRVLMVSTPTAPNSGHVRDEQVVIGRRPNILPEHFPVHAARFVPAPPGPELEREFRDLLDWLRADHRKSIDPVVVAAMAHYQFETLHPFDDGNGRIGRLMIVLALQLVGVLSEPTLNVSYWFEARRAEYYDRLLRVSTNNDWDGWVGFFAEGLRASAAATEAEMKALVHVQQELHAAVRASTLRADSAHALVDLAAANPSFTVRRVEAELDLSYGRANRLVSQLVDLGILAVVDPEAYKRRFYAPRVLQVLSGRVAR